MKRLFLIAAALLLPLIPCSPDRAAPPTVAAAELPSAAAPLASLPRAVDPLRIVVPAGDMLPGEDYDLAVSGLSVNDLVPGKILFLPPESASCRVKLVVQWSLAGLEPVITFRAKEPGSYRLVVVKALTNEQLLIATATVTVKGDVTPPDPPVPPVPAGKQQVFLYLESGKLPSMTPGQRAVAASLTLREQLVAKGHKFVAAFDPDLAPPPNKPVPKEYVPFLAAAKASGKFPCVVLASLDGSVVKAYDFPADEAALWKLLGDTP